MITHSPLMEEAVRYGHSVRTQVDIYRGAGLVYPDVPIVSGSVTSDRDANTRWSAKISLGLKAWEQLTGIDVTGCSFFVRRGVTTLGYTEMLPLGMYRIDDIDRDDGGTIELTGSGFESYVIDDRFLYPRQPPYGQSTVQAMVDLIGESMTTVRGVVAMNTYDKPVRMTAPWERDRIKALTQLATSIRAEVFADSTGTWVIKDDPTLAPAAYVYRIDAGEGGVLISYDGGDTRDGVYNGVVVTGRESEVEGQPPVLGIAVDNDRASPTFWSGPFGHKPRFYTNDGIDTVAGAVEIAKAQLHAALTAHRKFSFKSAAICFLEAGDVVRVVLPGGAWKDYLLSSTSLDLGVDGTLDADTYVMREGLGSES
jgi:hypothetical protein